MLRRAQSVRNHARPSLALGALDELGVLKEGNESTEDALRRQLLDKDRENDKLQTMVQSLQAQLAQRPPPEIIQELEKEYKNLELIWQGTQRENERCMAELDRGKTREKLLERELSKHFGESWQSALDIAPSASSIIPRTTLGPKSATPDSATSEQEQPVSAAQIHQIRMLVMGMEQRLQLREEKLGKELNKAEAESQRFQQLAAAN